MDHMKFAEKFIGQFCIVRLRDAGIHAGIVMGVEDGLVILKNSRRIYRWEGPTTLSELAYVGPRADSLVARELRSHLLRDWCEIIPTTLEGEEAFAACAWDGPGSTGGGVQRVEL